MSKKVYFLSSFILLLGGVGTAAFGQTRNPITSAAASETAALGSAAISRQALSNTSASNLLSSARAGQPSLPKASYTKYPWKQEITATVFWVGEPTSANNHVSNVASSWDVDWKARFGGFDDPDPARRAPDFRPIAFTPKQNPFYVALPYNDVVNSQSTKSEAARIIPWYKQSFKAHGKSVCRDRWLAVRLGDRICYAQWSDCGPFVTDDAAYVFGTARPSNSNNNGAGLDVSPAVRDYLRFSSSAKCDWRFVELYEVPDGPWKVYGENNHFIKARTSEHDVVASRLEELRRQRDQWFRNNGNGNMQNR